MPTLDEHFERELEIFRTEAEACAQFLFAFLAVHDVAYRKKAVHKLLNRAPLFWNTWAGGPHLPFATCPPKKLGAPFLAFFCEKWGFLT